MRRGMPVPTVAIEKGLLIPEDRPRTLCEAQLPRPGVHLHDPNSVPKKGKKKAKKGKKVVKKKKSGGGTSPTKKKK